MSIFTVEVVPIHLEPHENADSLSVVKIRGYSVCVRTADWTEGQLGAYIPPDSVVPDTEQFSFLDGHRHIKVKRLRGVFSMGMLIPAPIGAQVGDNVAELLNIIHYEPPLPAETGGEAEKPPQGYKPSYDVESFYRFESVLQPGEEIVATEKIHGASGRWAFQDGRFWVGSKGEWKRESSGNIWWRVLNENTSLQDFLQANENFTIYGEVYGSVQNLKYGHANGSIALAVFDIWNENVTEWIDYDDARSMIIPFVDAWVPEVYRGPFDAELLKELSDGPSLISGANHIREGIVVKPLHERFDNAIGGRVQVKLVGRKYLEKS